VLQFEWSLKLNVMFSFEIEGDWITLKKKKSELHKVLHVGFEQCILMATTFTTNVPCN
jgi:hypothetical protein